LVPASEYLLMKEVSIAKDTVSGIGWSAIERFSVQGINFIVQVIIARLLVPDDYGAIGMLAIFLQIAQVFIDSGFANALIQRQNCTNKDYCTVFYYNLILSTGIYCLFFLISPLVARFYDMDILTKVMRVISFTLVLNAIPIVHKTILVKRVDFKKQSFASLFSAIISGTLGIYLAFKGYGVWALCFQQISNSILQLIVYWIIVDWRPTILFSKESFNSLFSFGSKLLASSLINTIYRNLYSLVIGKAYSATDLGFYSRADQFAQFPSSNMANIITRVAFPILSRIQDDDIVLKDTYRKMIKYSSFLIFPLMFGLIAVSRPMIIVLLTDKWVPAVTLLQILCLDLMLDHITSLNLNLLYVKGRSDLALKLEIFKKTIAAIILFASIPFGIEIMCWGRVVYSVIATFLNTIYTKRLIGLSLWQQCMDFGPYVLNGALMCIILLLVNHFIDSLLVQLLLDIPVGMAIYLLLSMSFCRKDIRGINSFIYEIRK